MPDTGWVSPGSHSTLNILFSGGSWGAPANAYDGDLTTETLVSGAGKFGGDISPALILSGFGLSGLIPAGATFDGLEVRWAYSVPFSKAYLEYFWLEIPGVETTLVTDGHTAKAIAAQDKVAPYDSSNPSTEESIPTAGRTAERYTIGNSTATWHVGLDIAGLRDPGFGVVMLADCADYIEQALVELDIRVHYTGGDPMSVKDGGIWKTASPHVNDGGIWKPATPFTKDGGIWKSQ